MSEEHVETAQEQTIEDKIDEAQTEGIAETQEALVEVAFAAAEDFQKLSVRVEELALRVEELILRVDVIEGEEIEEAEVEPEVKKEEPPKVEEKIEVEAVPEHQRRYRRV